MEGRLERAVGEAVVPEHLAECSRRLVVGGEARRVRLPGLAWTALEEIAARERMELAELTARVARAAGGLPLGAALLHFAMAYFMTAGSGLPPTAMPARHDLAAE